MIICKVCKNEIKPDRDGFYRENLTRDPSGIVYWHTSCDVSSNKETISISTKTKIEMCKYLLNLKGKEESWMLKILKACGYEA